MRSPVRLSSKPAVQRRTSSPPSSAPDSPTSVNSQPSISAPSSATSYSSGSLVSKTVFREPPATRVVAQPTSASPTQLIPAPLVERKKRGWLRRVTSLRCLSGDDSGSESAGPRTGVIRERAATTGASQYPSQWGQGTSRRHVSVPSRLPPHLAFPAQQPIAYPSYPHESPQQYRVRTQSNRFISVPAPPAMYELPAATALVPSPHMLGEPSKRRGSSPGAKQSAHRRGGSVSSSVLSGTSSTSGLTATASAPIRQIVAVTHMPLPSPPPPPHQSTVPMMHEHARYGPAPTVGPAITGTIGIPQPPTLMFPPPDTSSQMYVSSSASLARRPTFPTHGATFGRHAIVPNAPPAPSYLHPHAHLYPHPPPPPPLTPPEAVPHQPLHSRSRTQSSVTDRSRLRTSSASSMPPSAASSPAGTVHSLSTPGSGMRMRTLSAMSSPAMTVRSVESGKSGWTFGRGGGYED